MFLPYPTMKRYHIFALLLAIGFSACNDDNPEAGPSYQGDNTNSNATRIFNWVTERPNVTDVHKAACRLEIPQLNKAGDNNLFIVHTTTDFGINYCMEYDCDLRAQRWSAFRWDASNSGGYVGRSEAWSEDPLIPQEYRTTIDDHKSNNHDRGHIIASADRQYSYNANAQTYYLSNMHPQLRGFNSRIDDSGKYGYSIWYNLENRIRNYRIFDIKKNNYFCDTLYVVKGGTIDYEPYVVKGDTIGPKYTWVKGSGQRLVCPNYFYMAILRKSSKDNTQGGYAAIGFWMKHEENRTKISDTKYSQYAVSIDSLEELTGIDFFCNLPDEIEKKVESNLVLSLWGL